MPSYGQTLLNPRSRGERFWNFRTNFGVEWPEVILHNNNTRGHCRIYYSQLSLNYLQTNNDDFITYYIHYYRIISDWINDRRLRLLFGIRYYPKLLVSIGKQRHRLGVLLYVKYELSKCIQQYTHWFVGCCKTLLRIYLSSYFDISNLEFFNANCQVKN